MKTILVAVDFSAITPAVVEQAARIAHDASAGLFLLYVGPPEADFMGQQIYRKVVEDEVPEPLRESYEALRQLQSKLRRRGLEVDSLYVRGKAIESILEEARRVDAEMIVVGSHKGGAIYRLLGSVSEGVLRGARCPVLVVPALRGSPAA